MAAARCWGRWRLCLSMYRQGLAARPFRFVAVEDIAETVARLGGKWQPGEPMNAVLDLMHPEPHTMASVLTRLRWLARRYRPWRLLMPEFMLDLGARAGDLSSYLGWSPPMRTTAIAELRRGVDGDPQGWLDVTGIAPRSLDSVLRERPATIESRWFARLYLLKALIIATLVIFWCVSGLIAITVAYGDALDIDRRVSGFPGGQSHAFVIVSSLTDIIVGLLIARFPQDTSPRFGSGYCCCGRPPQPARQHRADTGAMWIEPLGALVKKPAPPL